MSKKLTFALLALVLALAVAGFTAYASLEGKSVEINQRITGSVFGGIEVTDTNGITVNRSLLNLYAKGAPGEAHIEVVGGAILAAEPSGLCDVATTDFELTFVDGGFVETFNDHSMLFYVIDKSPDADAAFCVDLDGPAKGFFDYIIIGGTGRFEGATGNARVENTSLFVTNDLTTSTGTLRGSLQLP